MALIKSCKSSSEVLTPTQLATNKANNTTSCTVSYTATGNESKHIICSAFSSSGYVAGVNIAVTLNGNDITNNGVSLFTSPSGTDNVIKELLFDLALSASDVLVVTASTTSSSSYIGADVVSL